MHPRYFPVPLGAATFLASTALGMTGVITPIPNASVGRDILVPIPLASAAISPFRNHATDWPKYCANLEMTGVPAGETRITVTTGPSLSQVWTRKLGLATASQPTVVGNVVYMGDWSGNETALDVATGAILAQTNLGQTIFACNPPVLGITSAAAVGSGTLYVAGGDDYFYALDANTLALRWKTRLGDNTNGYYGWCSPALLAGKVIQGIASNCDSPEVQGRVVALDLSAGNIVFKADLAPSDPTKWGAGEWTSPAVDLAAGKIYVATANSLDYNVGYGFSLVRLSLTDLSIEDSWKIPQADSVDDADWGSSPTLFTDAASRSLVGAGQKDGNYYAFLRTDLNSGPVWTRRIALGGDCPQCNAGALSTASFDGTKLYAGGGTPPAGACPPQCGTVVALDPATGSEIWRYSSFAGPVIAPISSAKGVVFAAGGNTVVALDASNGNPIKIITLNLTLPNAAQYGLYGGIAISDGRIFFGDPDGNLYCYGVPR